MASPPCRRVSILTINDVYETLPADGLGGLAELATLVQSQRAQLEAEGAHALLSVNGDFLAASAAAICSEGRSALDVLRHLRTDIVVLGNHEFDFGADVLKQRIAEAGEFVWLGSNVVDARTGALLPGVRDTYVLAVPAAGGQPAVRLGFFGVCTEHTPELSSPGPSVAFRDVFEHAAAAVARLRAEAVDCLVAVTHVAMPQDIELARRVPGIDVILGGHDHSPYAHYHDDTLILKCGQNGQWLGRVDLFVEKLPDQPRVTAQWQMLVNRFQAPDPACRELILRWEAAALAQDGLVTHLVCPTPACSLDTRTSVVRSRPAAFGTLVAEFIRQSTGAELGIINGGFIRGDRRYPLTGDASYPFMQSDLQRELPWLMPIGLVEIGGADLLAVLGQMMAKAAGAYPHLSTTRFPVPVPFEPAHVRIGGAPVDPARTYRVATTEFLLNGGDGLDFSKARLLNAYATAPALPALVEAALRASPRVPLDFAADTA